jgi:4-hydroxy-tetrahydrodipicolinate synthase
MDRRDVNWKGCFCAIITPFKENEEIDEKLFRDNIELLISEGVDGIVISGCTGESWSLTKDDKKRLFKSGMEQAKKRATVIGGVGQIITKDVIDLAQYAKEIKLDGIMILPPYYCLIKEREVIAHYQAVSDAVKIPILVYNIPRRTGINMDEKFLEKLAPIEYVVAVKESSDDFIQTERTIKALSDRLVILPGHSAVRGFAAVLMGADGYVSSLETQVMGKEAISLYKLAANHEIEKGRAVQQKCLLLDTEMRKSCGTFPANVKAAMNMRGRPGGFPRKPILPPSKEEQEEIRKILGRLNLL